MILMHPSEETDKFISVPIYQLDKYKCAMDQPQLICTTINSAPIKYSSLNLSYYSQD